MALVILPCDMPWWGTLQNHIRKLARTQNVDELINGMQTIYTMCNVGLDPDEPDVPDTTVFDGLRSFLEDDLTEAQRKHFLSVTLATIANAALELRTTKPVTGLPFSLQQEVSEIEVSHEFACSLLAHAFLSSYSKRTHKTHPTLQDFNFSNFFPFLCKKFQKAKLLSIFYYFDAYAETKNVAQSIKISRQVMKGTEWLTIEDWLECTLPLCPLSIKHDNHMENAEYDEFMFVCFSSKKPGGRVLNDGSSRVSIVEEVKKECVQFVTSPELLVTLLCVEALEDNEVVIVENVIEVGKINNIRLKPDFEPRKTNVNTITVCLMDAENYTRLPLSQYEEDNVLRELNKALLGFRQKQQQQLTHNNLRNRRLSPIGESFSPTSTENGTSALRNQINKRKESMKQFGTHLPKGRFIVLGSSGELLPVSRSADLTNNNDYTASSSRDSSPDEFYSAKTSLPDCDGSDEEENARRYSIHLDTPENRNSFAERLREALNRTQSSVSTDSSYAVDISVAGSGIGDANIRMKRGGSRGFMLEEDSFDVSCAYLPQSKNHSIEQENSKNSLHTDTECKRNKGGSSKYSFSTDYNSELEEVYDQLSRWLEESEDRESSDENSQQQKLRDTDIIRFAGSLLKRTLSESFVGVPLSEGTDGGVENVPDDVSQSSKENLKLRMAVRSLSLELAKHKHKLAAQLISVIGARRYTSNSGLVPVVTGNWGCGSQNVGDPQLKLLIQWLAASVSGLPHLVYYTCNHRKLLKLDTVCRVLVDRQWNVGELVRAVIYYMQFTLGQTGNNVLSNDCDTLFDLLINSDEKIISLKRKFVK